MSLAPFARALAAQTVLGALSWRHYARLPALPPAPATGDRAAWPRVSVVVPARDEAARLPALLRSLASLDYPDYAVVVVDDESADDTATVAAAAGARVAPAGPLPPGWTGKSHACRRGAELTDGELLLFTDADTVHERASLRAAVAYLQGEDLGALSLLTGQRCETFFERLLLPVAYAALFAGVSPRRINSPEDAGRSPLANGQYILCRRDAYERAGGHAAVRSSIIEDAALARAFARSGVRYRLCRGESLVGVRMYGGLRELWAGFRKNAARYVLDDPRRLPATALHSTALATALPLLVRAARGRPGARTRPCPRARTMRPDLRPQTTRLGARTRPRSWTRPGPKGPWQGTDPKGSPFNRRRADLSRSVPCHGPLGPGSGLALALANYLIGAAGLAPWYRRFGVPARYALLYPLAVAMFGLVTADSAWRVLARRPSTWKGRAYG